MLLRQYTRGKRRNIFALYPYFLTLQRWQTFFNCANFLQIFFDFFVKMPFGVFRCGGGRFLGLRSDFDTPTAAETSPKRCPPHREGGGGWRVWLRRWRDGAFLGAFLGVFPWGVELSPVPAFTPKTAHFWRFFGGVSCIAANTCTKKIQAGTAAESSPVLVGIVKD